MAAPRQRWFWALLGTLILLFLAGALVTTCLFQRTPDLADWEPTIQEPEYSSPLPPVPPPESDDPISERLPQNVHWVLELNHLRQMGLDLSSEFQALNGIDFPSEVIGFGLEMWTSLPFEQHDPMAWVRSGYHIAKPWGLAWIAEPGADVGAWILLVPVRDPEGAEETTQAWLTTLNKGSASAWTRDSDYHWIVFEHGSDGDAVERVKRVFKQSKTDPLASDPEFVRMNEGLGGAWNVRLRVRDEGRSNLSQRLTFHSDATREAWPFPATGADSTLGMALRLTPGMQRMRLTIGGGELAALRVNAGMGMNTQERKEIDLGSLVSTLGMSLSWWQNLHEQDSTVKAPLEQAKVVAELGPLGLVVDLRRPGKLQDWEPAAQWWTDLLH